MSAESNPLSQEELQSVLWDILQECMNGRTEGHLCPFCIEGKLNVSIVEDVSVRLECEGCGKFFDGRLA
jgi:hypothetical protein